MFRCHAQGMLNPTEAPKGSLSERQPGDQAGQRVTAECVGKITVRNVVDPDQNAGMYLL